MSALHELAARVEALPPGGENALDVLCEVALFTPSTAMKAVRANNAGTKVVYTDAAGNDVTCWAMDWTANDRRHVTAAALRARAAMEAGQ
jgi:hypothetical protein